MLRPWPGLLSTVLCLAPAAALWAGCSSSSTSNNTYGYEAGTDDDASIDQDGGIDPGDGAPGFSNDISIIVEPGDDAKGLLDAINAATSSVHMTMYILTDDDIQNALIAKKKAGLDVKVILNQTFPTGGNSNSDAYSALYATDKTMVTYASTDFTYTHEKCVVIDGKTAWIMTMNTTLSSPSSNREYLAVDSNAADVAEADAIFTADFAKTSIEPSGNLLVAPVNAKDRLRALIDASTTTMDMEVESFSDFDVVDSVTAASDRGVKVRVVLSDADASSGQNTSVSRMKSHGATVVQTHTPYIHAKAIIVDGTSMYVGSENFTQNSLENNRELGLVTQNAAAITAVQAAVDTDFGAGTAL